MGLEKDEHPWTAEKLTNPHADLLDLTGLAQVAAVTVNEISTAKPRIDYYRVQLGADIETMEGAALHYCALRIGQPFLQIRAISNAIGERDKSKWKIEESIDKLNTELKRLIKLLA
jgi:futalosine hydrolase